MKKLLLLITLFFGVISFAQKIISDSSYVISRLPEGTPDTLKWVDESTCKSSNWYSSSQKAPLYFVCGYVSCVVDGKQTFYLKAYNEGSLVFFEADRDHMIKIDTREVKVSEYMEIFDTLSEEHTAALAKIAEDASVRIVEILKMQELERKIKRLEDSIAYLESFDRYGIGITDAVPYDNYGMTGARFRFFNASKKTIKYITFNFYCRNAVKDKVVSYGKSAYSTKGIGPIEAHDFASYEFDSVWLTDIVQTLTLTSVNILYMNGTSKTIVITDSMWIDEDKLAPLSEE